MISRGRHIGLSILATASTVLVGASLVGAAQTAPQTVPEQASNVESATLISTADAHRAVSSGSADIVATTKAISRAQDVLDSSKGHVTDPEVRVGLRQILSITTTNLRVAVASQQAAAHALEKRSTTAAIGDSNLLASAIAALTLVPTQPLEADREALAVAIDAVEADVDKYSAQQKKRAAEKKNQQEAQAAKSSSARVESAADVNSTPSSSADATEQSAAQSPAPKPKPDPKPAPQPAPKPKPAKPAGPREVDVNVRAWIDVATAEDVARAQKAVNAGGQVAVNYQAAGVVVVSAHNYYDSTALSLKMGEIVHLHGAISGDYKVVSENWVGFNATSADLAAVGTSVAMQTCGTDTMRIVGLSPL